MPDDRVVVLGLISSKVPTLESDGTVRTRIDEASRIVPLERLALSPQCGFASTHEGNRLTADDQRRKLALVGRLAQEVARSHMALGVVNGWLAAPVNKREDGEVRVSASHRPRLYRIHEAGPV